ncbi:protein ANKUB1-like, partial [Cyprinus carpio]|uniref:Protein ANKUB1-like n=1 Tax=Cyprinus carpio TaxID=7962 RepID=A0A9Q9VPK5_CYPCA
CPTQEVSKAILHVFSAITKETLPIMGTVTLLRSFVSKLKSVVSLQLGIPVSSFRLSTGSHLHLYDCDLLSDYAVQAGKSHLQSRPITDTHTDIIQIKKYVWTMDGMLWMVTHYHQTFKSVPLSHRNSGKYKDNVSRDRLIVVHSHLLLVLKLFVSSSIANLACCDPSGRNLLQIAIRHRRRECVTCLASKLYITVNFPGYSLPMYIYLQIKIWICRAQARERHLLGRKLGDLVHVDGFPMQKKSSNPRGWALRGCIEVKESSCGFPVTSSFVGPSCVCHYPAAPPSQSASVVLPQLHPPQAIKSTRQEQNITRNRACGGKNPREILPAENTNGSMEDWCSKVPLPHSFPDIRHRHFLISRSSKSDKILDVPQETFKLLNGRTLRENAIYCLAIASSFTEKPWLQQLALAQTLARRSVQSTLRDDLDTCSDNTYKTDYTIKSEPTCPECQKHAVQILSL